MTTPPANASASVAAARSVRAASVVEEVLHALGAGSPLSEDVIGDLAEEYEARRARDGERAARWWYARQATAAVPHLLWSAVRHGEPAARAQLLACIAGVAFVSLVIAVVRARSAPATLVAGIGSVPNEVVVSTVRPVKIPVRVRDGWGRMLPDSGVRFAAAAGAVASVSPDGVAQCVRPGKVAVRASVGSVTTRLQLDCQPVSQLRMKHWFNLLLGEPAQELHVGGFDLEGRPITRLAARMTVHDTTIAQVTGTRVRATAPGRTFLTVSVGEEWVIAAVTVFEPVASLARLRPDQRFVIAPVRLQPGESVRWPLTPGSVWLVNQVDRDGSAPVLEVAGPASCDPAPAPGVYRTWCHVRGPGATVTLSHPRSASSAIESTLAMERDPAP